MPFEIKWEKPVLIFYRERFDKPERRAFTVVKSKELIIQKTMDDKYSGEIVDFFPLMGDLDYISTEEGMKNTYVVCWFDDEIEDSDESWRRMIGVTFPTGISYEKNEKGKKTYQARFKAKRGKLE
jgi:hypothetical protein